MTLLTLLALGTLLAGQRGPAPAVRKPVTFATNPVDLRATPTLAGVRLRIAVKQPRVERLVRGFAIAHGHPMHLFVVGEGLEFFTHGHPVQQGDGVFMLDVALPRQGPYMAIAEFLPEGGTPQTFQQVFTTGAAFGRVTRPDPDTAPKIADGLQVSIDASQLKAGEIRPLTIRIDDAATGTAVTDLEPYLGASAHVLLVAADMTEAIHAHPAEAARGGAISFQPLLPRQGVYKTWFQFQRNGRVSTVAFVIDVP